MRLLKFLFTWNGRANRKQYLFTVIPFGLLASIPWMFIVLFTFLNMPTSVMAGSELESATALMFLLVFIIMSPTLCVTIKRVHDLNISAKFGYLFIVLIFFSQLTSFVTLILSIVLSLKKGTGGPNKYGDPV